MIRIVGRCSIRYMSRSRHVGNLVTSADAKRQVGKKNRRVKAYLGLEKAAVAKDSTHD